jgi:hypothetical protein
MTTHPLASPRPLVIELVGAPGSGKSTLLPVVLDACRSAGYASATVVGLARPLASRTPLGRLLTLLPDGRIRSRASWMFFRWTSAVSSVTQIARTWPLARQVVRSQWGRSPGAEAGTRRVGYWMFRLLGAHGLFLRYATVGEVLVLDEGYVHRVVQLFASTVEEPDREPVRRYLSTVPVPDLLLAVHVPVEQCVERVTARGAWARFADRDGDELKRFVSSAHRATELATSYARELGWNLIEVDNSTDGIDAIGAMLRAAVTERLDPDMVIPG